MQDQISDQQTDTPVPDCVTLAQALIRLESVTPDKGDAIQYLADTLTRLGFQCHIQTFAGTGEEPVPNLYARIGADKPNFCFAGHTDVVPVGARDHWTVPPFEAALKDDNLYGRGAADMKSAIAAFVVAAEKFLKGRKNGKFKGSLSLLITGDEEGPAINGTIKMLDWMQSVGEKIDYCLVGEPTNPDHLGQMIKVGRRGSLFGSVTVNGIQGHVAYPHRAENPIPGLLKLLTHLTSRPLDQGNENFEPSNLEILDIHVGNESHNVIPAQARARFNVRFNNEYTPETLREELERRLTLSGVPYEADWRVSGDSFLTPPCGLAETVQAAVEHCIGERPVLSTTGGTSDARFIKNMCPVVEFGLVGKTMHKTDEHVAVDDIVTLEAIYHEILCRFLD